MDIKDRFTTLSHLILTLGSNNRDVCQIFLLHCVGILIHIVYFPWIFKKKMFTTTQYDTSAVEVNQGTVSLLTLFFENLEPLIK